MANINRRRFLTSGAALGMAGGTGALSAMTAQRAFAADTSGYKALVGIFLLGGLDHADTVLPYDQPSYSALRSDRGQLLNTYGASRQRENLLKLSPGNGGNFGGREFALPPEMPEIKAMFDAGEVAIVGGVGPLIEPTNNSDIKAGRVAIPTQLFSHNDQQATWQTLQAEGKAQVGWGGAFAEAAMRAAINDPKQFAAITTSSLDHFLTAESVRQFRISSKGAPILKMFQDQNKFGRNDGADAARARFRDYISGVQMSSRNLMMQDLIDTNAVALENADKIREAYAKAQEVTTKFPAGKLGPQLATVASGIALQSALNISRQVYYVSFGSFDTHSGQAPRLEGFFSHISESLQAFKEALIELNAYDDVTTFTMTDFGRTVIDNGDGTDHGWGGHHFVMGGAVKGGQLYGEFAEQDIKSDRYTDKRGRLIPGVSIEQYAATLGSWFGLDDGELNRALPNLSNFNDRNLGFLSGGGS